MKKLSFLSLISFCTLFTCSVYAQMPSNNRTITDPPGNPIATDQLDDRGPGGISILADLLPHPGQPRDLGTNSLRWRSVFANFGEFNRGLFVRNFGEGMVGMGVIYPSSDRIASYIGFNAYFDNAQNRIRTIANDGNGGSMIFGDQSGTIHFASFARTGANSQVFTESQALTRSVMRIYQTGEIVMGGPDFLTTSIMTTSNRNYGLYVAKGILTDKVKIATVNSADWSDYVFNESYNLRSLEELENFVKEHKHLPNVPSAAQVEESGVDLIKMDATLLEKIEELTLYTIQQQKMIDNLSNELTQLKNAIK